MAFKIDPERFALAVVESSARDLSAGEKLALYEQAFDLAENDKHESPQAKQNREDMKKGKYSF